MFNLLPLIQINKQLSPIGGTPESFLAKLRLGLRAIDKQTSHLGEILKKINPNLEKKDVIDFSVNKLKYAQPICDVGFKEKIPPIQTEIEDLYIADTCFYYPEDRGVSESVKLAKKIIRDIID